MLFWQLLLCTCNYRKAVETTFVQKIHTFNVDEIDTRTVNKLPELEYKMYASNGFESHNISKEDVQKDCQRFV